KMANMATDIQSRAGQRWDKLENIFEDRVAKALNKLGVPSANDVDALKSRIDELNKSVQKMSPRPAAAKKAAAPPAKKTTRPAAEQRVEPWRKKRPAAPPNAFWKSRWSCSTALANPTSRPL
ncbi:MAG: hypothetical protein B7Y42_15070, partial [Polaromonas sp. 28-63-22]